MSHFSLYFTRGTPRSTTPSFTLDFSKEPYLESLAERLYQQYTQGLSDSPDGSGSDHSDRFVTHGHTTFERSDLGWVPRSKVAEEQSLVTPTFTQPKSTDIALSNGLTSSSSAPPAPTQTAPPPKPVAPVNSTASPPKSVTPVKAAEPPKEAPLPVNATETPKDIPAPVTAPESPRVAPQKVPPICREKPSKPIFPTSSRQGDLRRSVALLNANRSQGEKTQPVTQVTSQAPDKAIKPSTPVQLPDSQTSMSSSEYRPSSPSSQSSRSPTPAQSISSARRRSGRTRAEPATYNLKKLTRRQGGSNDSPNHSDRECSPAISESPPPSISPPTHASIQRRQSSQLRQPSQGRLLLQEFPDKIQTECATRLRSNISKLLWTRELQGVRPTHELLRATVSSNLKRWKTWKGASNDVGTLAWSPDGGKFAAGATALSDEYNRGNNLVSGDLSRNSLHELPDHNIRQTLSSPTADPRVFPTVSTVQWVNKQLYTASYDHTVKIWNTGKPTSPDAPTCVKTLRHDSKVSVMAVSKMMPHLVATGTAHSFSLWNLLDKTPSPKPLEILRDPRQKANIVLEPTVLAWGQNEATKNYLVGGMTENIKEDLKVALCGHLGMWRVTESSIERRKLSPDSQNIFDVKWHPSWRRFAVGSTYSQSMNLPLRSKTVVQLYDIESDGRVVVTGKCACSAVDMNEVTFCPMDSTYVTASCTDGSTYVWDSRNDSRPIHRLSHGPPTNSPNMRNREYNDFGVRAALWGSTMDQFYTGGSDGYLKQWDIRRATEDALVANTVRLNDGIMSGAFSPDKSQLLLGDYAGGIHVLSCEHFEDELVEFDFNYAPDPESVETSGIHLAKEFLDMGRLIMDPLYGPVQGPNYNGPYAPWARDLPKTAPRDKIRRTPLLSEYQMRQFEGPPPEDRRGLDAKARRELQCQFNLARARQARRWKLGSAGLSNSGDNVRKRKRDSRIDFGGIDKDSPTRKRKKKKKKDKSKRHRNHVITINVDGIIDLTMDSDSEQVTSTSAATPSTVPMAAAGGDSTMDSDTESISWPVPGRPSLSRSPVPKVMEEDSDEDYWWPDSRHVDANLSPDEL